MQAVIKAGGKQFIVEPNQTLNVDLVADGTKKLEFEPLLVIDGDKITVGAPAVSGVIVTAEVLAEVKGEKIKVLKFKAKKRVKKLTGHRQHYSQIKILTIGAVQAKPVAKAATEKPTTTQPAKATA
jgi:large subunit ribosomal protein L21